MLSLACPTSHLGTETQNSYKRQVIVIRGQVCGAIQSLSLKRNYEKSHHTKGKIFYQRTLPGNNCHYQVDFQALLETSICSFHRNPLHCYLSIPFYNEEVKTQRDCVLA